MGEALIVLSVEAVRLRDALQELTKHDGATRDKRAQWVHCFGGDVPFPQVLCDSF